MSSYYSPYFEDDVKSVWNYENSIEQYKAEGGTSRSAVKEQIAKLNQWLMAYSQ